MLLKGIQARKALAEFVGTFFIVFAGCGTTMVGERFPGSIAPGAVPLVFGLTVATMVYAVGHVSGAHFNPAVTLAFALARHFPRKEIAAYWLAQFLGAGCAVGVLFLLLPPGTGFGATIPNVSALQALGWEILLTFCLMFVIISVATDTRAVGMMAGAAIGAAVTLAAFVGGPVTGASLNPARSLAPAIAQGKLDVLWLYLIGPMVGAVLAAFTYEWIRCAPAEENPNRKDAKGCC